MFLRAKPSPGLKPGRSFCLLRVRDPPLPVRLWVDATYVTKGLDARATSSAAVYGEGANGEMLTQM
jgi:hypothetical protein